MSAAKTARSAQSRRGVGLVRRSTATSWRNSSSSTSLVDALRPNSKTSLSTCRKIRYSNRSDTAGSCPTTRTAGQRWSAASKAFDVGRPAGRRRQGAARCLLSEGTHESLKASRLDQEQEVRLIGVDGERVWDVGGPVHERPSGRFDQLTADPDRQVTLKYVEGLGLAPMHMQWRRDTLCCLVIDKREPALNVSSPTRTVRSPSRTKNDSSSRW